MLKKSIISVIILILIVLSFAIASEDSNKKNPVLLSLGEEQFNELGLNKLNIDEKKKLFKFMQPIGNYSYLENSAALYLERKGWIPMHVVGIYKEKFHIYNVAICNYQLLLLDLFTDDELLKPGVYWVNKSSFRMDVILHNGEVEDYSYETVEQ